MLPLAPSSVLSKTLLVGEALEHAPSVLIAFSCGFVLGMGLELSIVVALFLGSEAEAAISILGNELYAWSGRLLESSGALGAAEAICKLEAGN